MFIMNTLNAAVFHISSTKFRIHKDLAITYSIRYVDIIYPSRKVFFNFDMLMGKSLPSTF